MGARPCFTSCFGIPLQTSVIIVGVIELFITIIATLLNIVKYAKYLDPDGDECEGKDVCIGPLIKYSVFDAFFGVLCALFLIVGGYTRNQCLLVTWMIVTVFTSLKYVWVVVTHDWTSLEDWISITYLIFYISVFLIILSFMAEMSMERLQQLPGAYPAQAHVVVNQTFLPMSPQPHPPPQYCPTTPPGYPPHPPPYSAQPPNNPGHYQ